MVNSLTGTLGCQLVVLPQERGEFELLEVVVRATSWTCWSMTGSPPGGSCSPLVDVVATLALGRYGYNSMSSLGGRPSILHSTRCLTASKLTAPSRMASRTASWTSSGWKFLHQSEHLHELPLSSLAHPRLQQPPQHSELLGQLPSNQRRRLIQCPRLLLKERQVMERVEDEVVSIVRTADGGR